MKNLKTISILFLMNIVMTLSIPTFAGLECPALLSSKEKYQAHSGESDSGKARLQIAFADATNQTRQVVLWSKDPDTNREQMRRVGHLYAELAALISQSDLAVPAQANIYLKRENLLNAESLRALRAHLREMADILWDANAATVADPTIAAPYKELWGDFVVVLMTGHLWIELGAPDRNTLLDTTRIFIYKAYLNRGISFATLNKLTRSLALALKDQLHEPHTKPAFLAPEELNRRLILGIEQRMHQEPL